MCFLENIALQHEHNQPPALHQKIPTISPAVESVVFTALAKDPHQRFASVMAFSAALEKATQRRSYGLPQYNALAEVEASTPLAKEQYPSPVLVDHAQQFPDDATTFAKHLPQKKKGLSRRVVLAAGVTGTLSIAGGATAIAITHDNTQATMTTMGAPSHTKQTTRAPAPTPLNIIITNRRLHTQSAFDLAWSPSGDMLASGSIDQTVKILNANTGSVQLSLQGNAAVAWSPDAKFLATSYLKEQNTIVIYEIATGQQSMVYANNHNKVQRIAWALTRNLIVSGDSQGTINVWDPQTGNTLFSYLEHRRRVSTVAWSPDETLIASGGDKQNTSTPDDPQASVRVWDAGQIDVTGQIDTRGDTWYIHHRHSDNVKAVSWSPDSTKIASGGETNDKTVVVWDRVTESIVYSYTGHTAGVETVAWSPDGKYIASGSADYTLHILDAQSGQLISIHKGSNTIWHVVWSPDSQRLAFSTGAGDLFVAMAPTG